MPCEVSGKLQFLVPVEHGRQLVLCVQGEPESVAVRLASDDLAGVVLVAIQCIHLVSHPARGAGQAPWPRSVVRGWQGAACPP